MKLNIPTRALASSILISFGLCGSFSIQNAKAMIVSAESIGQTVELAGIPGLSIAGPKGTVIFTHPGDAKTDVILYDFDNIAPVALGTTSFPYPIDDVIYEASDRRIFVVGQKDGDTIISGIDIGTGAVKSGSLPSTVARPLLATDANGRIFIADAATNNIHLLGKPKSDGDRLTFEPTTVRYDSKGPINEFAVSQDGEFLFISDGLRPQLTVLRRTGYLADDLPLDRALKGATSPVVPVKMTRDNVQKALGTSTSLLLADYNTETLTAVTFEPLLRSLSVAASGSIALPIIGGSAIQKDDSTGLPVSPSVIASNADQTTIVVGNRFSTRVIFLTKYGRVLERTGSAELTSPPKAFMVSDNGQHVLVTHENSKTASVLDLLATSSTNADPEPQAILQLDGNTDIREMQRLLGQLGFPVGTVDGVVGPLTTSSLRAVEATRKVDLDIANLPQTITVLQNLVGQKK